MATLKANLAPDSSLKFDVKKAAVEGDSATTITSRICVDWQGRGDACADDLLVTRTEKHTARIDVAAAWLKSKLAGGTPFEPKELERLVNLDLGPGYDRSSCSALVNV